MQMRRALGTIAAAGLLAGTLDAAAASIRYVVSSGKSPLRVFIYIASGVFGEAAYDGRPWMPALGLLFHYAIATAWAAAFTLAYPLVRRVSPRPLANGVAYGIVVWLGMTFVVVPRSNAQAFPFVPLQAAIGVLIHIVCVGLPIALIVDRRHRGQRRARA
jgi:hypothetical protein